jgi:hypothetical protein
MPILFSTPPERLACFPERIVATDADVAQLVVAHLNQHAALPLARSPGREKSADAHENVASLDRELMNNAYRSSRRKS